MPRLTAGETARTTGGRLVGDAAAGADTVVADSRTAGPGTAFVAVRSGHDHVASALGSGASFAIVQRAEAVPPDATAVVVDDVEDALARLATDLRRRLGAHVVGITGSTGKTITKDLLAAALRSRFRVHATAASQNAELGVPLTVLGCPDDAEILVCELGARAPGQIAALCEIVAPRIGVITGIGWSHVEVFGSRDAIASTKSELLASLPPDGVAVVPAMDEYLHVMAARTSAPVRTVGPGGHVRLSDVAVDPVGRPTATVHLPGGSEVRLRVPLPGRPLLRNGALALAVAVEMGADPHAAAEAISHAPTSAWRMEVHEIEGRTIVNDAYNANPTSVPASLRTVMEMAGDRPAWAVLGEMAELGPLADEQHRRIGRIAAALGFEVVAAVGSGAALIAEGAGGVATRVDDAREAAELIRTAPAGAVVLVKGSRVTGLERVTRLLTASGVAR
ncbi:MAG TPA: UDP-N-acetylmuramoyl-tripeptide--D-alanyl-D-alanine ligase [Actinomycetota bacterium]|nr:UDP-N-acetylmuramoyl-tripeptide--D-alanyl-D-alanine ligase [Actinomycetota bacterium]